MNSRPSSEKLFKLKKLMHLRVKKAHRAYTEKQLEWNKLKAEADDLRAQFDGLKIQLDQVAAYNLKIKNLNNPVARIEVSDRRRWLIYDQELVKYNLDIAEYDVQEAGEELATLKTDWLRAQHREKTITEQAQIAQSDERFAEEAMQEIEIEDLHLSGVTL